MDGQTHGVPGTVQQARQAVIRTEPRPVQHAPRGGVDRLARRTRPYCLERCALRRLFEISRRALLVARLAEDAIARDVRTITLDDAAGIDEQDAVLGETVVAARPMQIGARLTELRRYEEAAC